MSRDLVGIIRPGSRRGANHITLWEHSDMFYGSLGLASA